MPLNNWESDEMWEIAVTATSRDSAEILQVQALPWAWTCPERPWWEGTFNVPPECQLYVVHGMNWLTCRCTKVKKDGLIYWSRKGTVSLTEMCCQMMAGRAAKSPPDWLLYLPPDPSPPGLWQVRSKGRFTCGCELGSCELGKQTGLKATVAGWDLAHLLCLPGAEELLSPQGTKVAARTSLHAGNQKRHLSKQHLQILKCCHCPSPSVPFSGIKLVSSVQWHDLGIAQGAARQLAQWCCQSPALGSLGLL